MRKSNSTLIKNNNSISGQSYHILRTNESQFKTFIYKHNILLNETNAVGGVVYFSNFVKWQGIAREEYFIASCPDWDEIIIQVVRRRLNMITVEEHSYFIEHAFFGSKVEIMVNAANIRNYCFDLIFRIDDNEGKRIYEGMQKIAFDNYKGKYTRIPESMRSSVESHEITYNDQQFQKLKF